MDLFCTVASGNQEFYCFLDGAEGSFLSRKLLRYKYISVQASFKNAQQQKSFFRQNLVSECAKGILKFALMLILRKRWSDAVIRGKKAEPV